MERSWLRLLRDDGHDTGRAEQRSGGRMHMGRATHQRGLAPRPPIYLDLWATLAAVLGAGAAYAVDSDGPMLFASAGFAGTTMRIFTTDIRLRVIYDRDIVLIYLIGFFVNLFEKDDFYLILLSSFFRSFLYFSVFYLLDCAYRAYRSRDAIGHGDMKLSIAVGVFIDLPQFPFVIVLAALLTLAFGVSRGISRKRLISRYTYLPFGAFFMASSYIFWLAHI
ncbi:A24 family peptidase [Methylobacterium nonmethylotrophicum]|uniref:Prepilin peptidase n=1 Tax=Methylobacterium nonmethylotrophicum TaxID=1141884 RepID=A0A4Z0NVG1_9HYPH|nr:A24 family peptidase [Methylobacterium nonmethylotrophicum]TGE01032.1 prepilin peptidase [Methylobacterium nonmethylotrophicum]